MNLVRQERVAAALLVLAFPVLSGIAAAQVGPSSGNVRPTRKPAPAPARKAPPSRPRRDLIVHVRTIERPRSASTAPRPNPRVAAALPRRTAPAKRPVAAH